MNDDKAFSPYDLSAVLVRLFGAPAWNLLVEKLRREADEAEEDGDFCCALTRRHDADAIEQAARLSGAQEPQHDAVEWEALEARLHQIVLMCHKQENRDLIAHIAERALGCVPKLRRQATAGESSPSAQQISAQLSQRFGRAVGAREDMGCIVLTLTREYAVALAGESSPSAWQAIRTQIEGLPRHPVKHGGFNDEDIFVSEYVDHVELKRVLELLPPVPVSGEPGEP